MTWSIGEIGALATKAARGSGMEWGLAEETGYAIQWLQKHHLPGVSALCKYLSWRQNGTLSIWPDETDKRGYYCPILTGAAYGDGIFGDEVKLPRIRLPLLLVPFVALLATETPIKIEMRNIVFLLTMNGFGCSTDGTSMLIESSTCQISMTYDVSLPIRNFKDMKLPRVPKNTAACINVLNEFAKKTYAPATDASRLAGAGSGLSDND